VGGTVLYEAPLTIQATATGDSSTFAGIGRLVSEAQSREAPVQRLADAVAGKFCYGVMAAAAATFTFWSTIGVNMFPGVLESAGAGSVLLLGIKLAVDVLVVACPCALGLATPTAVLVGSSLGATRGLLLRGGDVLEKIAGVEAVVFDKTGTLTQGQLRLAGLEVLSSSFIPSAAAAGDGGSSSSSSRNGENYLVQIVAAVESATRHPLAAAVAGEAGTRGLASLQAQEVQTVPGCGVTGWVEGRQVAVGRPAWVLEQVVAAGGAREDAEAALTSLIGQASAGQASAGQSGKGKVTQVLVAVDGQVFGALRFSDQLRPEAVAVVRQLQEKGIRVYMLSGDDPVTASAVAAAAGIPEECVKGGASPGDKLEFIRRLQSSGQVLAMVGDGVNDAPALAAADVGIALKGGLDAAGRREGRGAGGKGGGGCMYLKHDSQITHWPLEGGPGWSHLGSCGQK
jgi:Cu2+-exporting ATPase